MEFVDTHCHLSLSPLIDKLNQVIDRAARRGVTRIVVPAYDLASWDAVERIGELAGVYPALGLHPWVADQPLDSAQLKQRLVASRAVAVGEIGLDFKIESFEPARQLTVLRTQLEIAQQLGLPVLLHCRGAFDDLLTVLQQYPQIKGVIHAYSRGPQLMDRLLAAGLHIAFGGAITRPGAKRARRSATLAPANRLLLETDAPSIGLDGVDPERVEPAHVADIAQALAELRHELIDSIAKNTTQNAQLLFRLA